MAIDYTLMFDRIRACLDVLDDLDSQEVDNLAAADSLLAEWAAALADSTQYSTIQRAVIALSSQGQLTSAKQAVSDLILSEINRQILDEIPTFSGTQLDAIDELKAIMVTDGESVTANATSVSTTSPTGKPRILATIVDPDGISSQRCFPETVACEITATNLLKLVFPPSKLPFDVNWPGGSGQTSYFTPLDGPGLIYNGSFNEVHSHQDFPAGWEVGVGTVGTSILQTAFATKTITISGTPSAGWYAINLTDLSGNLFQTEPLDFDADESSVESAIQAVPGFESVTVSTTGTSPNFTHTLTFEGIAGTPASLTIKNQTTGGTITPADGSGFDAGGMESLSMKWVGQASPELTAIRQRINLVPLGTYAVAIRLKRSAATTGAFRLRLVDGDHSAMSDEAGTASELTVNVATLATGSFDWLTGFFRTPEILPDFVKIELAMTTTLSNTGILYFDRLILSEPVSIGTGGLKLLWVSSTANAIASDSYTLETTNNLAGRIQSRFVRHFNKQLPTSGSPTISDT